MKVVQNLPLSRADRRPRNAGGMKGVLSCEAPANYSRAGIQLSLWVSPEEVG